MRECMRSRSRRHASLSIKKASMSAAQARDGPTFALSGADIHTSLLPQEARELYSTFSRDLPRQQVPFWHGPASHTHGKSSPPVFFPKKSRSRKIALIPHRNHFFSELCGDVAQRRKKLAFWLAFALISTKFSPFFLAGPLAQAASKGTDNTHTSVHMPSAHALLLLLPLLTSPPTEQLLGHASNHHCQQMVHRRQCSSCVWRRADGRAGAGVRSHELERWRSHLVS